MRAPLLGRSILCLCGLAAQAQIQAPAQPQAQTQAEAPAQPDGADLTDRLFALSLDELLNVKVTTATKTETSIGATPALVEVITREQIKQRGYRHLADVFNNVNDNHQDRGNWGIGEPLYQSVGFGFRFDTKQNVLLLFNGQRLNAFYGGGRYGNEEYLLANVERIEIIRGPGSALYGSNAFTAVVNLISRTTLGAARKTELEWTQGGIATAGGYNQQLSWLAPLGGQAVISGSLRAAHEDGQSIAVKSQSLGTLRLRDGIRHAIDGELVLSYGALRLFSKVDHQARDAFTTFNVLNPSDNQLLRIDMFAYAAGGTWRLALTDALSLQLSAGYHMDNFTEVYLSALPAGTSATVQRGFDQVTTKLPVDGQGMTTQSFDAELQLTWNYFQANNLVLGVYASHDGVLGQTRPSELEINVNPPRVVPYRTFTDPSNSYLLSTNANRVLLAGYGQVDLHLGPYLSLVAGARLDGYLGRGILRDQNYAELSPRGGLVLHSDTLGRIKASYGRAMRVPNGFELLISFGIAGSPRNRPEHIQVTQLNWERAWTPNFTSELGGFYATIHDRLQTDAQISPAQVAAGFVGEFANLKTKTPQSSTGIDAKLNLRLGEVLVTLNGTRYLHTDNGNGGPLTYIPLNTANLTVNVPIAGVNLNLGAIYRGHFTRNVGDPGRPVADYLSLQLTAIAEVPRLPLSIRVGGRNLLQQTVSAPSSSTDFTANLPGRAVELWADATLRW